MIALTVLLVIGLPALVVAAWARGAWLQVHTLTEEPYYTPESLTADYRTGRVIDGEQP